MGYLTTVTIYNDDVDMINPEKESNLNNIKKFAQVVYKAACGSDLNSLSTSVGNCSNFVTVQKTRHADDHTIYVHMGNTVVEMNPYSEKTQKIIQKNPEFADKLISFMDQELKELKKLQKAMKAEKKSQEKLKKELKKKLDNK